MKKKKTKAQPQIVEIQEALEATGSHADCNPDSASTIAIHYPRLNGRSPYIGNIHFKLRAPDPAWDLM